MKMNRLLKQILLFCACLFAVSGHAMVGSPAITIDATADSLAEEGRAYAEGDYKKAAKLYRPLAEKGDAEAQLILGSMYDFGLGVPQDYKEAVKWYRLGAGKGNGSGQAKTGAQY